MLKGKTVLLGVTGSIAAYKIANLASMLSKLHADIHVLMTENATKFINPITFETLTGNKCLIDTFDRNFQFNVGHVSLAKKADVVLVAPASANVIGKMACGIADDMLSSTIIAATGERSGAADWPGPAWPGRTGPARSSWCSSSFPWPYRCHGYGCWRRTGSRPQRPGC